MSIKNNFNMIVAMDLERGIGKDNKLPWYFPNDLKRFSKLTKGSGNNAIIMGSNTWISLPRKPLLKRDNLILSTKLHIDENSPKNDYIKSFNNIEQLMAFCKIQQYDTVWIIGGQQIYNLFIDSNINNIYITFIKKKYNCDTFFPELFDWNMITLEEVKENDGTEISYQIYIK